MQATADNLFLFHDQSLHVFYKGKLVQCLVGISGNTMWYRYGKLITIQLDDYRCNLCIWTVDDVTGKLTRCLKMPDKQFAVDFAGLWQQYLVICSGESGNQTYYDIDRVCEVSDVVGADINVTGIAYQIKATVWPEKLRRVAWIRPWLDPLEIYFNREKWDWCSTSKDGKEIKLHAHEIAVTSEVIWGHYYELRLRTWSRANPAMRLPQLCVLFKCIPGALFEKIFFSIWYIPCPE
jgi:hypothetical protein